MRIQPDLYHGEQSSDRFFEGWYFKLTTGDGRSFAFIPGVGKGHDPHSFLQIINGPKSEYHYFRFPIGAFHSSHERLEVGVGANRFSLSALKADVKEAGIKADLRFTNISRWPDSRLAPGSMGVFNHLSFLECYNQVCALDGRVEGTFAIDGKHVDLTDARIYVEKNWGRSFPKAWFWAQCNRFDDKRAAFTCSIGEVPIGGMSFRGIVSGLMLDGAFYPFTTMNGTAFRLSPRPGGMDLVMANSHARVKCEFTDGERFVLCKAPNNGEMCSRAPETLTASMVLSLSVPDDGGWHTIYQGTSSCCGIEYGGQWERKAIRANARSRRQ